MSNPYAPPSGDRPRADQHPDQHRPAPTPGQGRPPVAQRPPVAPPRPPDPAAVVRGSRQIVHFGLFMLAAILLSVLNLPWKVASLAFLVAAVVTGIRALVTVVRGRVRGSLVPMLVLGLVFSMLFSLTLLATFATWPLQVKQQDCLRGALTISAQAACQHDLEQGLKDWEQQLRDRSTGG
ncbi:MAG TPA: hypothetical protein VFW79_14360 [Cellulomonas sp.]|uniref:hypothetical protein n=1 Tax=Cellulomonas sp. TaxID=40001 RepID=UPI002E31F734|nr:hypothetical protein [Cellulomonas sp.]HEX5333819.1 hypothetical protein [Cellulomonas sp.]